MAEIESGGRYTALGTVTKNGDRAYGKYQVMGRNIPVWTETHLGKRMTIQEFVDNPLAQDLLAGIILTKRIGTQHNTHDPIAMRFSGQPLEGNIAQDITGTTVPSYVARVLHINTAYANQ